MLGMLAYVSNDCDREHIKPEILMSYIKLTGVTQIYHKMYKKTNVSYTIDACLKNRRYENIQYSYLCDFIILHRYIYLYRLFAQFSR